LGWGERDIRTGFPKGTNKNSVGENRKRRDVSYGAKKKGGGMADFSQSKEGEGERGGVSSIRGKIEREGKGRETGGGKKDNSKCNWS